MRCGLHTSPGGSGIPGKAGAMAKIYRSLWIWRAFGADSKDSPAISEKSRPAGTLSGAIVMGRDGGLCAESHRTGRIRKGGSLTADITKNGKRRAERKQDSAGASEAGDSYGDSGDQPDRGGKSAGVY